MSRLLVIACCVLIPAVASAQSSNRDDQATYEYEVRGKSTKDPTDRSWHGDAPPTEAGCQKRMKELEHDYYDKNGLLYAVTDKPTDLYVQKWRVSPTGARTSAGRVEPAEITLPTTPRPGGGANTETAPEEPTDPNAKWVVQTSKLVDGQWVPDKRWEHPANEKAKAEKLLSTLQNSIKSLKKTDTMKVEMFPWNPNDLKKTYVQLQELPLVDPGPAEVARNAALSMAEIEKKLTGPWQQTDFNGVVLLRTEIFIIAADGNVEVSSGGGTGNSYYAEKRPLKDDGSFTFVMKQGFANTQGDITGEGRLDGEKLSITMRRNGEVTKGTMIREKD